MEDNGVAAGAAPFEIGNGYSCLNNAEWWAVVARGGLAFRFGPFTGPEAGKILSQGIDEKLDISIVGNCGPQFDWDLARDLMGAPRKAEGPDAARAGCEAIEPSQPTSSRRTETGE